MAFGLSAMGTAALPPTPVAPPSPGTIQTSAAPDPTTNTFLVQAVIAEAQTQRLKLRQWGHGRVRFLTLDDPAVHLEEALAAAQECLRRMERITGSQSTFGPALTPENKFIYLVLFRTAEQVVSFDDALHGPLVLAPDEQDLVRKHPSFTVYYGAVGSVDRIGSALPEWTVAMTAEVLVDCFFAERAALAREPSWLREGLAADMQLALRGQILTTAVAFQDKPPITSADWYGDVRRFIASPAPVSRSANELLTQTLDGLPNSAYEQMWSLETFLRQRANEQRGPRNRLRRAMDLIATGMDSSHAVSQAFQIELGPLTAAWREWATSQ